MLFHSVQVDCIDVNMFECKFVLLNTFYYNGRTLYMLIIVSGNPVKQKIKVLQVIISKRKLSIIDYYDKISHSIYKNEQTGLQKCPKGIANWLIKLIAHVFNN